MCPQFSMSLIRKKHNQHNSVKTFSPIQNLSAKSPEVLSEHLTYLELNGMDRITPDEIVQMVMAREQAAGISLSNVNQYVQFSNRISLLGMACSLCEKKFWKIEF